MDCKVYMVKVSYQQKPYRRSMMQTWGGSVTPSPSEETEAGRKVLAADPDTPGSLGIAISEAVEAAVTRDDVKYSLGSVLNHVLLHQSIIGLEAEKQFELVEDSPDVVIGCCGGGSNFAGLAFPFVRHRLAGKEIRFLACEPHSCPTMSRGQYRYDFGDTTMLTPLIKMFTLGHSFVPPGIHAGGLRYHGMAPLVSLGVKLGIIEPKAYHQLECFEVAQLFAATEGFIAAPETSHAIRAVVDEAVRCREEGKEECILFNFSGHGLCDLGAYDKYFSGELEDYAYPQEKIEAAIAELPPVE
jgi:tryptophan synthase beta chain